MTLHTPAVTLGELVFGEDGEEAAAGQPSASERLAKPCQSWLIVGSRSSVSMSESLMASTLLASVAVPSAERVRTHLPGSATRRSRSDASLRRRPWESEPGLARSAP